VELLLFFFQPGLKGARETLCLPGLCKNQVNGILSL